MLDSKPTSDSRKVLIVDADSSHRQAIRQQLSARGWEVEDIGSARRAMATLLDQPPDLLICDLVLPQQDGLEVCRFARSRSTLEGLPILALAETVDAAIRRRALDAGATDLLRKPMPEERLITAVAELLGVEIPAEGASQSAAAPAAAVEAWLKAREDGGQDPITQVLDELEQSKDFRFWLLIDPEGRPLHRVDAPGQKEGRDLDALVGVIAATTSRMPREELSAWILETPQGPVVVRWIGHRHLLAVGLGEEAPFGKTRYLARRIEEGWDLQLGLRP